MDWNLIVRPLLVAAWLAALLLPGPLVAASDLASLSPEHAVPISPLMDLSADMPAEEFDGQSVDTPGLTIPIAEPGSVGLMLLAGLAGGAVAMRRRLG